MISFPRLFAKPLSLKSLPLKRYLINLSLDRLVCGVDSIHIDVHISPQVLTNLKQAVSAAMIRHSRSEYFYDDEKKGRREDTRAALKHVCLDVLGEGINTAKSRSEAQIDFLGQAALAKMFLEEIRDGYRGLLTKFEILIRTYELSPRYDQYELFKMKEMLVEIKQNQQQIIRLAGMELFQVLAEVNARDLKNIREANFPAEYILPDFFFTNPTLHSDNAADDFLLLESYVLMGQRSEEPDNYNNLQAIVQDLLSSGGLGPESAAGENEKRAPAETDLPSAGGSALDVWFKEADNIDLMFNCFDSEEQYQRAKERPEAKDRLPALKERMRSQAALLELFYKKFKYVGLLQLIIAAYEMKTICLNYCPPLRPLQVREYLVEPESRKAIVEKLKRRKAASSNSLALAPLQEAIGRINRSSPRQKKKHLLNFLQDFCRYHRDLGNGRLLRQAMDAINLVRDEKLLLLSKQNRLLYEFPLAGERAGEEKPVISHVIIKADIRGSMDVTETMIARGLNPASYFSLNFFDPISELIGDYNASKEFIEGDAIILSIFENQDTPQGWYSVARACGLAVNMLNIVQRYNLKNQKHGLPILELGIGVCYQPNPPAYLFDGGSRIMISQAINLADRLSSCDKRLRKLFKDQARKFNLFVYQNEGDEDREPTADNLALRYNVNGIELDPAGFDKLSREINLKRIEYLTEDRETVTLYTGKVPTLSGHYQRLVIREAAIMEIEPATMAIIGPGAGNYYEVCTQPAVYEFIDRLA